MTRSTSSVIGPGSEVVVYAVTGGPGVPAENPRLWGVRALVESVHEWGAVVAADATGGTYRAGWGEMVLVAAVDGDPLFPKELPVAHAVSATGHHNGVANRATARDMGYSGDECSRCNGMKVRWAGKCKVCDDCGEGVGDCS